MTFWPPVISCATPRMIAAAAMVVTIGSVRAAPISSPWTRPVRMPNATAIPRAAHGPRCRVAANRMAALATTALSDRENIRPTMVMMLSPTATIPTRDTESTSARKLFVVANSGTNTQARMNRIKVTAPMTAGPSRFDRQRRLVVLPVSGVGGRCQSTGRWCRTCLCFHAAAPWRISDRRRASSTSAVGQSPTMPPRNMVITRSPSSRNSTMSLE